MARNLSICSGVLLLITGLAWGTQIDVVIAYDNSHLQFWGHEGILEEVDLGLKFSEAVFSNSGMDVEFNIVHAFHTPIQFKFREAFECFESCWPQYTTAFGADLFIYLANNGIGAIGKAALSGNYLFANLYYFRSYNTGWLLVHEIGHSLGAGHEQQNESGHFPWSKAFVWEDETDPFCTVTASGRYGIKNRIPFFSNPRQEYNGTTIGAKPYFSDGSPNPESADNHDTIRKLLSQAAKRETPSSYLWSGSLPMPNGFHRVVGFGYLDLNLWHITSDSGKEAGRYFFHAYFGWCWVPESATREHIWFRSLTLETWVYTKRSLYRTAWVSGHPSGWVRW